MRLIGLLIVVVLMTAACNLSTNDVANVPTARASLATATLAKPTRTPIPFDNQVHPTQLVVSGTLAPPPLPLPLPAQSGAVSTPATAPDQAVKDYYALVSQGRYDLGWSMLTDAFKQKFNCCAPNYNYTDYVKWWDTVNTVDIRSVKTVSQTGDHAVVYVEFAYVMNDGRRSALIGDPYIALVYNPTLNTWQFDDKRATA